MANKPADEQGSDTPHPFTVNPSPPPNEQSPSILSQQIQNKTTPSLLASAGMRLQSLAEWQLQAVLFHAKLTQYYETFISQGGDDIDQIMQCDEAEFLEIMSLVGMATKPLHVRRLQRTLNEFSLNRAQFLINAVPFIGPPPMFPSTSSSVDNISAALQILVPGYVPTADQTALCHQSQPSDLLFTSATTVSSSNIPSTPNTPALQNALCPTVFNSSGSEQKCAPPSATAHPLALLDSSSSFLLNLVNNNPSSLHCQQQTRSSTDEPADGILPSSSKRIKLSFSPPATPADSNGEEQQQQLGSCSAVIGMLASTSGTEQSSSVGDYLTNEEVAKLRRLAQETIDQLPAQLEPRQGPGRRRMERGLLEAMNEAIDLAPDDPRRLTHFRLFGRIYGRFDTKRKPDRALTRHELVVNEAAAQLAMFRPELLVRRELLFPLARKLVRLFELPGTCRSPLAQSIVSTSTTTEAECNEQKVQRTSNTRKQYERRKLENDEEEDDEE